MRLPFTKMQGLGNDFVVLDGVRQTLALDRAQLRRLGDRHFGIGCDQILLVEPPTRPDADFRYRIFNADGSEVEQCGNGARCFARFVREQGLSDQAEIRVETARGLIVPRIEADGQVTVDMGLPDFTPAALPFIADTDLPLHPIEAAGERFEIGVVSMGNPHAVLLVDSLTSAPVERLGPALQAHPRFPRQVNVGFMQIHHRGRIGLRVYERGAGETLACGTGACAAVVSGIRRGLLDWQVTVETRGGELSVRWAGPGQPVAMTGPAVTVFHGVIELD
ncbi:diaminopimelate epimerase [Chitinimonas lacunae]|uniref:Diaminopimelate epimerase n=1 Tax=Chitinimonas lacunae TaxID=1963018 RepID=A0ABV8MQ82_9NEIS